MFFSADGGTADVVDCTDFTVFGTNSDVKDRVFLSVILYNEFKYDGYNFIELAVPFFE